jgi:GT2 family glycosyltransferase
MRASIIVATRNRAGILKHSLEAMEKQDFPEYEIIVVDDASTDNTLEVLKEFKVKAISMMENVGPAAARNIGIKNSRYEVQVIMDDDCIPERDWLKKLISGFEENVGVVTSFSIYGGTSTAYLKKAMEEAGYFDEDFPFEYREDTDLVFRIMDRGYEVRFVPDAKFTHIHNTPEMLTEKLKYVLRRLLVHQVDPLLYRKHPERTKEFLDIKFGFLRNPVRDFETATGRWENGSEFVLSSPQGVRFIENKTPLHTLMIILGGVAYVVAVKIARLYGSIKYRKFLI